jgi:hypothetical protein
MLTRRQGVGLDRDGRVVESVGSGVCVCVSAVFWGGLLGDFYFSRVVGGWVILEGGFLFWAMRFVKGMRRARIRIWITGRESLFPF